MTVREMKDLLGLEARAIPDPDAIVTGGYTGDLLSWVMGRTQPGQAWITIMSNVNILAVATLSGVSAVILAENVNVEDSIAEKAAAQGINLLRGSETAFALSAKIAKIIG